MSKQIRKKNWKLRNIISNILFILSIVVLSTSIILAYLIPKKMEEDAISYQEQVAADALESGYKCYRVQSMLYHEQIEDKGKLYTVSTENGESFGVLISENTKENRTGLHASYVDVFVMETSTEVITIDGTEITLYTDCYATLDYIAQGDLLAGAILSMFLIAIAVFVFIVLLVVGIVLKVSAVKLRRASVEQ